MTFPNDDLRFFQSFFFYSRVTGAKVSRGEAFNDRDERSAVRSLASVHGFHGWIIDSSLRSERKLPVIIRHQRQVELATRTLAGRINIASERYRGLIKRRVRNGSREVFRQYFCPLPPPRPFLLLSSFPDASAAIVGGIGGDIRCTLGAT